MKDENGTKDGNETNAEDRKGSMIGSVVQAILKDGYLAAAGRQGADELGEALKAFPESIQVHESGSIWNPTQGEIASNRKESNLPSPSQIAANPTAYLPEQGRGNEQDRGQDRGMEM